jgi:hypothetical protein
VIEGCIVPKKVQRAMFHNRDRCAMNTALQHSGLIQKDPTRAILVFSGNVEVEVGRGEGHIHHLLDQMLKG